MAPTEEQAGRADDETAQRLLDTIGGPADLKSLSLNELKGLAEEIRATIIETAARNGGHLAPHLGVVELALAIHHVFDTDRDKLIWDVGHQCYAHKLLTGRRDRFDTIRKKGGLSGYPKRSESPYDSFGTGHSSTSISAALGMAVARDRRGSAERVIAVIGDGAMTGGMAFEALAHAGHLGTDLLVVLNDNKMSISPNVGSLSAYFNRLITGGLYHRTREDLRTFMERMLGPGLTKAATRFEHSVKGFLTPGTLFEELGFKYVGPVDGHDLETLVECFSNLKNIRYPIFFHCVTQKGRGYSYAEQDPQTYHGVKAFNIETGEFETPEPAQSGPPVQTFTEAFATALIEAAEADPRVVGITAAMPTGTGLSEMQKVFPERVFDVGICEQHAVTFAAGLAAEGLRPVCAIYSTFLQRGYDQYVHDVCMQHLPVVFAIDRAGAVGEDSPTQQGAYDLSFLRLVPGVTVLVPRDDVDLAAMLRWALDQPGPVAIRYARGKAPTLGGAERGDITRGEVLREGADGTLLAVGPVLGACLAAAERLESEGLSVGVADARAVKPLDAALVDRLSDRPIVTVEENTLEGGFGSAVLEHFGRSGRLHEVRVKTAGFPDVYMEHATRAEQLADAGLDAEGIADTARAFITTQRAAGA
ncbi:MAG: 1-deoxy-D-xylulose-5-phosphate synthase [Candidatus Hydrogenedentes bacterium]|nr:1-deoxy-D-xylulose-5-phosphate synthase [Candidatus Hydrogenedentota bacterium]